MADLANALRSDLAAITDAAVYNAMSAEQPSLVATVSVLVRTGRTPAEIERAMRQRFGNIQMIRNVRHVAEHLARTAK